MTRTLSLTQLKKHEEAKALILTLASTHFSNPPPPLPHPIEEPPGLGWKTRREDLQSSWGGIRTLVCTPDSCGGDNLKRRRRAVVGC